MQTVTSPRPVSTRAVDGMIARLRSGAHIRYKRGVFGLVTHGQRSVVSLVEFDALLHRRAITHTFDHNLYQDGPIWIANREGGA